MIIVLQRVSEAAVEAEGRAAGRIGRGVCLLLGVEKGDGPDAVRFLARKTAELRIFPDEQGKMNLSLKDVNGEALVVSQFTLAASVRKGRRPSFELAEEPARAEALIMEFVALLRAQGIKVETGVFQTLMKVRLINDGPVTFILLSRRNSSVSLLKADSGNARKEGEPEADSFERKFPAVWRR